MSSTIRFIVYFLMLVSAIATAGESMAQPSDGKRPARAKSAYGMSVRETFEPAFRIEPLSQKVVGRGGELVPFEFSVQSENRDCEIEVLPIGLRQELSGMILHDERAQIIDGIRLISPSKMKLKSNVPTKIQGVVQIPSGSARFHPMGIMVRDSGAGGETPETSTDANAPKTSVRFVTQYVLRLDIETSNAKGESPTALIVESVNLVPFEGRPKLVAQIANTADTAFEFELRARVKTSASDRRARSVRLAMPAREALQTDERYTGRILGKSRLNMVELLPEAIGTGNYEVEMEIVADGKTVSVKSHPLDVDGTAYPAQEVLIAQLGKDVQVSPAQLELSQLRGGNRKTSVVIKNNGKDTKTVDLSALDQEGLPLSSVIVQPTNVVLAPGGSRKVTITMKSQADSEVPTLFGALKVQCQSDRKDYNESRDLPIAIALKPTQLPEIKMSSIAWDDSNNMPRFRSTLTNEGQTYIPVNARLTLLDERGNRIHIPTGFGKWLMPGDSMKLDFPTSTNIPPGKYVIKCEVINGEHPLIAEQRFEIIE